MSSPSEPERASASGAPPPMSPSELPTIVRPTAPPSSPTDSLPRGVVAGRVAAITDTCTDVTTDDGVTWSLAGEPDVALEVGAAVTARVTELEAADEACGSGRPARLVSIRVVGQ